MPSIVRRSSLRFVSVCALAPLASLVALACAAGCSAKGDGTGSGFTADDAGPGTTTDSGGVTPVDDSGGGGGGFGDVGVVAPPGGDTVFYAHSGKTLFRVDAKDPKLGITNVGDFDCIGTGTGMDSSMTDIAVDKTGKIYGIGPKMVFADMTITGGSVACLGKGSPLPADTKSVFYGASFAPVGTLDANVETLVVGNTDGELYKVDPTNGAVTQIGTLGVVPATDGVAGHTYVKANQGKAWELSGDIVFLQNGTSPVGFATVRDCPTPPSKTNCNTVDTLIEIDLSKLKAGNTASVTKAVRGQVVKASGCQDSFAATYGHMYGIAAYQGDIFGFSDQGYAVKIDNVRGGACRIADHSATVTSFAGAGITTVAPVIAPPQ